jgi:hypothetical protein
MLGNACTSRVKMLCSPITDIWELADRFSNGLTPSLSFAENAENDSFVMSQEPAKNVTKVRLLSWRERRAAGDGFTAVFFVQWLEALGVRKLRPG